MSPVALPEILRRPGPALAVLNVCGGHERSISMSGLRTLLPEGLRLIPGPGCPVCVCPAGILRQAIGLVDSGGARLVAFGDLLRVPVSGAPHRSLLAAGAATGRVHGIASPQEAVALARAHHGETVVFLAAGFETTMAPVAASLLEGWPDNLLMLGGGRRTAPVVSWLLEQGPAGFDGVIAPGHVAAIMGADEWDFLARDWQLPVVVAGFQLPELLDALARVVRQLRHGEARLENAYPGVVRPAGNVAAQRILHRVFDVVDAPWRGVGTVPASGYRLRPEFAGRDAVPVLKLKDGDAGDGDMPPGCRCGDVVLGRLPPQDCPLYGRACTPADPVGPCMVSDEGACHIWWQAGLGRRQ